MDRLPFELVERIAVFLNPEQTQILRITCAEFWRSNICSSTTFAVLNIETWCHERSRIESEFESVNWQRLGPAFMAAAIIVRGHGFDIWMQEQLMGANASINADPGPHSYTEDDLREIHHQDTLEHQLRTEVAVTLVEEALFLVHAFKPLDWGVNTFYALRWAAAANARDIVSFLLEKRELHELALFQSAMAQALQLAAACENLEIVELLLAAFRLGSDASQALEGALFYAAERNLEEVVTVLMGFIDLRCSLLEQAAMNFTELLRIACTHGNARIAHQFLSSPNNDIKTLRQNLDVSPSISPTVFGGHVDIVDLLIEFHPATKSTLTLLPAAKGNHIKMVKHLLFNIPDLIFEEKDVYAAFLEACTMGYLDIASHILIPPASKNYHHPNPKSCENPEKFLLEACENNHPSLVDLLLIHMPALSASFNNNTCLRHAASNGHTEIVRLLLDCQQDDVDPSCLNNISLRNAAERGYVEIVERLLQDSRVDSGAQGNAAIRFSAERGHAQVVELLLKTNGVDPAADDSFALRAAARNRHLKVVELLIRDGRSNVSAREGYALKHLEEMGAALLDFML
ncbi:ankyrin repeat-containing domain protein [Chytriomyces cf. hyalinus JEL632]|nr:ankyrin repeat-containing domain protein [Chytriomyces cf. hyalinus JEL632]